MPTKSFPYTATSGNISSWRREAQAAVILVISFFGCCLNFSLCYLLLGFVCILSAVTSQCVQQFFFPLGWCVMVVNSLSTGSKHISADLWVNFWWFFLGQKSRKLHECKGIWPVRVIGGLFVPAWAVTVVWEQAWDASSSSSGAGAGVRLSGGICRSGATVSNYIYIAEQTHSECWWMSKAAELCNLETWLLYSFGN